MDHPPKDKPKNTSQDKDSFRKGRRKPFFNWFYAILLLIMIGLSIFTSSPSKAKEIGWLEFEQTMLSQHDVQKIVVLNKEIAEIYINPDKLKEPDLI